MTIYKSTKIGLTVAGFALAAQFVNSVTADDAAPSQNLHTQETAVSSAYDECMSTRSARSYEPRSATDRSTTERKTRSELYAERETKCKAALNTQNAETPSAAKSTNDSTVNTALKL
jgi:predicted secreted protein